VDRSRVVIGAGEQRWLGWLATQRDELDLLDERTFENFFGEARAQSFLCEHTWEHLSIDEGIEAARICWRFLEDGGRLRVAVPDGRFPSDEYQRTVQVGGPGPADHPAADHKVVYIAEKFAAVFEKAGFDVVLLEWWDSDGNFRIVPWSVDDGPIYRSSVLDHRNEEYRAGRGAPGFTSLIVDAIKVER
jgi:predicted SAM-dependent methyltransferase